MPVTVKVEQGEVQVGLGELRAGISDYGPLLRIAGNLMRASVARTFRDEGSPAGSWPRLALSTLKNKAYTSGHKLLILSGRLFGSINYDEIAGNILTIGTNVIYARVQQEGSADRSGGSIGPQAKIAGRDVKVSEHDGLRVNPFRQRGVRQIKDKNGKWRTVHVRAAGPDAATRFKVKSHSRYQNIPARPFLVFRPEDPSRIAQGMEAYLRGKTMRIGRIASAGGAP